MMIQSLGLLGVLEWRRRRAAEVGMPLRPTHLGYAYQDLLTAICLVDVALGRASRVIVDTKMFSTDRFDDITFEWGSGRRDRLQIKHTDSDRELTPASFTRDRRSLRLDLLFSAIDRDLQEWPGTGYRLVLRDMEPHDPDLASVLRPVDSATDPGPALPGLSSTRWRFDANALRAAVPWRSVLAGVGEDELRRACDALVVDVGAPACSLDIRNPGPAEEVLLRRVADELGAGRPPNRHRTPEDCALALIEAAKAARSLNGTVTARDLLPRLGIVLDFGAVREGHPVDRAVEVPRPEVLTTVIDTLAKAAELGRRVVLTGAPGIGKSWLCEQIADRLDGDDWVVARHHCWLGAEDTSRGRRVLADVVIGSLLRQLEGAMPKAVADIRPRYAATAETLTAAVAAIRYGHPGRRVILIVDGLDHVTRVLGRTEGAAFDNPVDPAHALVDELAVLDLPAGSVLLLASQPGDHLEPASGNTAAVCMSVPPLSRREIGRLADRLGVLTAVSQATAGPRGAVRAENAIDMIQARSRGNTLYATYLCRQALGPEPAPGGSGPQPSDADPLDRLRDVPESAQDLDNYYAYLLAGLTASQRAAVGLLAVCDFAVTADELRDIFPDAAPMLAAALTTVAPIIAHQPGIGGLKIHHESFSSFVRRHDAAGEEWITTVRAAAANWLARRGGWPGQLRQTGPATHVAAEPADPDTARLLGWTHLGPGIAADAAVRVGQLVLPGPALPGNDGPVDVFLADRSWRGAQGCRITSRSGDLRLRPD
jgi:hypothetical protein